MKQTAVYWLSIFNLKNRNELRSKVSEERLKEQGSPNRVGYYNESDNIKPNNPLKIPSKFYTKTAQIYGIRNTCVKSNLMEIN
jgi:hypothetical protein